MKERMRANLTRYQVPILYLVIVQFLDIVTTQVGLRLGAVESNFFFESPEQLFLVKAAVLVLSLIYLLSRLRPGEFIKVWFLGILFTLIPVWNILVIIIQIRA